MSKRDVRRRALPRVLFMVGAVVAVIATALAVAGCGGSSGSSSGGGGGGTAESETTANGPFTVNWATTITTLDPAFECPFENATFAGNFYGTLLELSYKKGKYGTLEENPDPATVKPSFATSWKSSNGGKTYTFDLLSGKKFANGDPINAEAVKYSLERTAMKLGGCGQYTLEPAAMDQKIKSIEAPSPTKLVINLTTPWPYLLYGLATPRGAIMDPVEIEAHGGIEKGKPNQWLASHIAGGSSGPYILKQYVAGDHAVMVRNPNYFGKPAVSSPVRVNFITSTPTLLLQAKSGQADVTIGLPAESVASLASESCCKVAVAQSATWAAVSLRQDDPLIKNQKFREAMAYAIPYEELLSQVAHGYGELYYGPIAPGSNGYNAELEKPHEYNLDKAKELMAESGESSPTLNMLVNPAAPETSRMATILQGSLQQIGVNVNIESAPPAEFATKFNSGEYQAALNFEVDIPFGLDEQLLKMQCGSPVNNQNLCIPGTEELFKKTQETTGAQQQGYIDQLTKKWTETSPTLLLYQTHDAAVLNKAVKQYSYATYRNFSQWGR